MVQYNSESKQKLANNDTLYEVVMLADQLGPSVYNQMGNLNTASDAFGRLRMAMPHTLFDSSFRFADNRRKWAQQKTGTANSVFNANQGLVDLSVGTANGDEIVRETNRAFPYQPGKSLISMNTFTFNSPKANLRQRVGYFGKLNGVYLEQDGLQTYIVKRTSVGGTVDNIRISQSSWNVDNLDGSGPSGLSLDMSTSQIFWTDFEWLGVGSVRTGFVINGQFIVAHIFHHANSITGTYITTASLPCRYELTNTGVTASSSSMKQICSTVISEGGYTMQNITRSATNPIAGKNLLTGKLNPMVSIRLRSGRTDAIVIPVSVDLYGIQGTGYNYHVIQNVASLRNASWVLFDSAGSVEYDLSADSMGAGQIVLEGIFRGQSTALSVNLNDIFNSAMQLTRGVINNDSTGDIFTIAITPTTNNDDAVVALTWQEQNA